MMKLTSHDNQTIENTNFDYLQNRTELFGMGKDDHRFLTDKEWQKLEAGNVDTTTDYLSRDKISRIGGIVITDKTHGMRPFKSRSDGDVVYHAVFDSIAMALKIGNIGSFFSNRDPQNTNRNSEYYLCFIREMLEKAEFHIIELGIIITKKKPYLNLDTIRHHLARIFKMDSHFISVFATTGEDMGMAGKGLGVHVDAFCKLSRIDSHD